MTGSTTSRTTGPQGTTQVLILAAYLRYSSELQDETSSEDQLTRCREAAKRLGGYIPDELVFRDEAISGQSMANRPGLQQLLRFVKERPQRFQGVVCDDTSRLARNLEEIIRIYKIVRHHSVFLYFASSGLDSRIPGFEYGITFSGIIDEQFIPKLREAIVRGMKGQIRRGYTAGGPHYGYDNIPEEDEKEKGLYGRPKVKGVRQVINEEQAEIIRRIFRLRAEGESHATIARRLDAEAIPPPQDRRKRHIQSWSPKTVRGILLNRRFRGIQIWGRTHEVKDPETGRAEARTHPQSDWVIQDREDLRIVSDELWAAVQAQNRRISELQGPRTRGGTDRTANSRKYIFSTNLSCGLCGGNFVISSGRYPSVRYGCYIHRDKGNSACSNAVTISQQALETQVLARIVTALQTPEFSEEMTREFNRQLSSAIETEAATAARADATRDQLEQELTQVELEISNLAEGFAKSGSDIYLEKTRQRESRRAAIKSMLSAKKEPFLPRVTEDTIRAFLKRQFASLVETLRADGETAKRQVAKLIDKKFVLTPEIRNGAVVLVVTGDLRLFADDDAMLVKSVEQFVQHCTSLRLSLDGLVLFPYKAQNKEFSESPDCQQTVITRVSSDEPTTVHHSSTVPINSIASHGGYPLEIYADKVSHGDRPISDCAVTSSGANSPQRPVDNWGASHMQSSESEEGTPFAALTREHHRGEIVASVVEATLSR